MGSGKLELVLHSGKGLKDVKHFGTMNPYAQVWVAGGRDARETRRYKTDVAKDGGPDPVWNCPMQLDVASMDNNYTVFCEISHDGTFFDRKIGEVQVSSKDLLAGGARGEKVRYPVTISSGEVKGEIILSHKFSEPSGEKKAKVPGSSRKKPQPKKKNGLAKRVVERVATKLATDAVLFAGAVGVLAMADEYADADADADADDEDEDYNEDEDVDDDDDEDEGEGEDVDEDEDEDEDEYEDEYEDEDEDEYEYEDEDY